jgi:DNA-binding MarR family transcriptional regulator
MLITRLSVHFIHFLLPCKHLAHQGNNISSKNSGQCPLLLYLCIMKSSIQQIRAFNRFYTDIIGLLEKHLLNSDYSLVEVRVLYEIHAAKHIQASQIMQRITIDKSYLSRVLKRLEKDGLITKQASAEDARAVQVTLTPAGSKLFQKLDHASNEQIDELLTPLSAQQRQELVQHMMAIMGILKDR